jgi:outer membrane cobalamin receptor
MSCILKKIINFTTLISIFLSLSALPVTGQDNSGTDSVLLGPVKIRDVVVDHVLLDPFPAYRNAAVSAKVDSVTIAGRFEPSVLPVLTEQIPGLFVTSRGIMGYGASAGAAGGMSIRGIGGQPTSGLLVMVDGVPQYMGLMGHPLADSYLAGNIESVEVVSGANSALYGSGAMGGVINIKTREMRQGGTRTTARLMYGSYNTASATVGTEFRRNGFKSNVSLNHNRSDGHRPDMNFAETGGSARLGYEISDKWNVGGGVDITASRSSNPGTVSDPVVDNDANITRGSAYIRASNEYYRTHGSVDVYHNFGRHDINDGYRSASSDDPALQWFHSRDHTSGVNARQSVRIIRELMLEAGVEARFFGGDSYNNVGVARSNERDESQWEASAYLHYTWLLWNRICFNGTLRADHHSKAGTEPVPQLGIVFVSSPLSDPYPRWRVKASVGKGFRNPTIRELYMFPTSNPALRPERIVNYDLSAEYRSYSIPLKTSLALFFIDGDNIVQTVVRESRPIWENTGRIRNYGVEAGATFKAARYLDFEANYSWLAMRHKVTGAPEHKLYVSASYNRLRWGVRTGLQYVNSLYTQVVPQIMTQNYTAWNLQVWWNISRNVRVFARGENLLDRRYEIMAGYTMPGITAFGGVDLNF